MSSTNLKIVFVVASGLLLLCRPQTRRARFRSTCAKQPGKPPDARSCRAEVELVVSIVKACADDRKKLCPGLKSGNVVRECMKSHMGDLGNVCKTALAKAETGNK